MKVYHGTTDKGLKAILSGENHKPNGPWTCSDQDGCMYVWPLNKVDSFSSDDRDEEAETEEQIIRAFESAQVQAITTATKELFVLEIEVPDDLLNDDDSCENMSDVASYLWMSEFKNSMVVKVYSVDFNIWHSPFIVRGLLDNPHFNKYSIDNALIEIAHELSEDCFLGSIYEFEYSDVSNNYIEV